MRNSVQKNSFVESVLYWYGCLIFAISIVCVCWQVFIVIPRLLGNGMPEKEIINHLLWIIIPLNFTAPFLYYFFIYSGTFLFCVVYKKNYCDCINRISYAGIIVTVWEVSLIIFWSNF